MAASMRTAISFSILAMAEFSPLLAEEPPVDPEQTILVPREATPEDLADLPVGPTLGGLARRATPAGSPGDWVTNDDYPATAIRQEQFGTTGFIVAVGKDGIVSTCLITVSSGSAALDQATCRLIAIRAQFIPARNSAGQFVEDRYSNRVRWVLPSGGYNEDGTQPGLEQAGLPFKPVLPLDIEYEVDVDANGKVETCRLIQGVGVPDAVLQQVCGQYVRGADFPLPFLIAEARAKHVKRTFRSKFLLDIRERQ